MSSSYHPQSDGQTKVMNRTLEQYLRCFTGDQPRKWVEWISWAEYSYNTAIHSSTKLTPFEGVYGIPPPTLLTYVPGTSRVQAVDECLRDRDAILKDLRHNLQLAQNRMKCQANQHRRDISFNMGDYVYLKLQPYRQTSMALRLSQKLSPRFFGPYQIISTIGLVAYKLSLPAGSQIHNVFHVSLLQKYHGPGIQASPQLPFNSDASTCLPEPEAILDRRIIRKGNYRPKSQILVKWKMLLRKMQPGRTSGISVSLILPSSLWTRILKRMGMIWIQTWLAVIKRGQRFKIWVQERGFMQGVHDQSVATGTWVHAGTYNSYITAE